MFHVKHIKEDIHMNEAKALIIRTNPSDLTGRVFHTKPITFEKLSVKARGKNLRALDLQTDGSLAETLFPIHTYDGYVESDMKRDLLKLVWLNGYRTEPPLLSFLHGAGLKLGAIAMSRALDSHDIIAVGATDFELEQAINALIRAKGGIAVACLDDVEVVRRPTAVLDEQGEENALREYAQIERKVKQLQTPLPDLLDWMLMVGAYDLQNLAARLFV